MKIFSVIFLFFLVIGSQAQGDVNDTSLSIPMFYASYGFHFPGGDLADRFGNNSTIGAGFQWKSTQYWVIGADFNFIFGNSVKNNDSLMFNLKTHNGYIISRSGLFAEYSVFERGFYFSAKGGKLISLSSNRPNSGILLLTSAGYMQHKIRIEVLNNDVPQLDGDYKKGYDRLTGGFLLSEFVGYMNLSNNRLYNFFGGIELSQAFTQPFRDVNFDTRKPDGVSHRLDLLFGFKIGWAIPLFTRQPEKYYLY